MGSFTFQDPISQFFVRNPAELLHKEPEAAVLDSNNDLVRALPLHSACEPAVQSVDRSTLITRRELGVKRVVFAAGARGHAWHGASRS